jgi:hypothetical protein
MSNIININNYQPNIHGYLNRNKNTWKWINLFFEQI